MTASPRSNGVFPGATGLPELLTPDEVASWLKTSVRAIYSKVERGSLPGAVHVGRRLYFIRAELLDWLNRKRVPHLGGSSGGT
jgi:excisionase family DNA binding protein